MESAAKRFGLEAASACLARGLLVRSHLVVRFAHLLFGEAPTRLITTVNRVQVEIELEGVTEAVYSQAGTALDKCLKDSTVKNRDAIAIAFLYVLRQCPAANPSDLWHHVIYRLYCQVLTRHRPQDPKQSWVRASGEALEQVVQLWYAPVLNPHQVEIKALISRDQKGGVLKEMGLGAEVGDSKLDVALYLQRTGSPQIFGGVHVKASLAERVSDDIPASRAMMTRRLFSPLWTLDVKSFPPPGDLVNRGELGTPDTPSEKRKYIEEHGDFDNCYSANSRTVPSRGETSSGKRIYTLNLSEQPDQFARDVISRVVQE